MELRPRKGRVSSASEPNPSTPYAASAKSKNQHGTSLTARKERVSSASKPNSSTPHGVSVKSKNQHGTSLTVLALASPHRKPSHAKSSSRSTASKSQTYLSTEEDDRQQENSVCNRKDDGQEDDESVQEVNCDTVSSRETQGYSQTGPDESDAIELDSDSIDIYRRNISKVNGEHRKVSSYRKAAPRRNETLQALFEDGKCALDGKDTESTGIDVLHQNEGEVCRTNIKGILGTSTPEAILIANGCQKKVKQRHTSSAGGEEVKGCSLVHVHLLADNNVRQALDGRETDLRGHEVTMVKETCVEENDEQMIAQIKRHSCANLQGSALGEEESARGNCSTLQQEGFVGTGSESAGTSPGKTLKKKTSAVKQTSRKISEEKVRNGSSHKKNAQEPNFDSNEVLCSMKHIEIGKEEGNEELASTGKNERIHLEGSSHHGSTEETDVEKDTDTQEYAIEAEGTNFQRFSSKDNFVRREQDCEAVVHSYEDEEEMARIFIGSLKARLQQRPVESFLSIQKEMARKAGGCEEGGNVAKKAVVKEERQITSTGSRLSSVGLSWSPETGLQANKSSSCLGRNSKGTIMRLPETIWQKEKKLEDGLLVLPVDPRKLNKLAKKQAKDTAGAKWFDLSAPTITPELKKDLQLLKLRNVIDPKRHYKAEDSKGLPKYFQVGTVIGGPGDFYSGRLTKKERKSTLADELLSDSTLSAYRKRKYLDIQDQKQAGGKKFWKNKKNQRTPSWARV